MEIQMEINAAETTFEVRLAAVEATLAELQSAMATNVSASVTNTRKTLPASMATLLSKQGVAVESLEAGSLDNALASLSIEQRIAVKAQLLRNGLLS
ncbi:MAG: hypothetical protein JSS95_09410 [Acidobacteria bacterium]|nr:hypothetical protein [Acidobacteriota bacterium]